MQNEEQTPPTPKHPQPVRTILLALAYLHTQGYEQLRISCGQSPNGLYWRYQVLPRRYFDPNNGLLVNRGLELPPHPKDSIGGKMADLPAPEALAEMWLEHYECLQEGLGDDKHYAKWYANFLDLLKRDEAPVMYAESGIELQKGFRIKAQFLSLPKFYNLITPPQSTQANNPLHGVTLETMLHYLVNNFGWEEMARQIDINCFKSNPTIKSSLTFLRKTPWARQKVEKMYLDSIG